jgi:hypothetical protein
MKIVIISFLGFLLISPAFGQNGRSICHCPQTETEYAGQDSQRVYHFSNGKKIILCGYKNSGKYKKSRQLETFSEFTLTVCGQDSAYNFWGAVETCNLTQNGDTLIVNEIEREPVGKNYKYIPIPWLIEKIFFEEQSVKNEFSVNRNIRKYTIKEIRDVLREFEWSDSTMNDHTMEIANKLLIATISGSTKARKYFNDFTKKFEYLDGAFSEEYGDLEEMLKYWDEYK